MKVKVLRDIMHEKDSGYSSLESLIGKEFEVNFQDEEGYYVFYDDIVDFFLDKREVEVVD